jgi:uncharacterized protein (TIGR02246 family)
MRLRVSQLISGCSTDKSAPIVNSSVLGQSYMIALRMLPGGVAMRTPVSPYLTVAMLLMASTAVDGANQASPEQGIRAVVTAIDKAVSRGDADGYVADAADDAIFLPSDGPALTGKDAIRTWARGVFENLAVEMKHVPEDITVSGRVAFMHGRSVGSFTPKAGGSPVSFDNKYLWVLRRDAKDRWQIIRVIWNSNTPAR